MKKTHWLGVIAMSLMSTAALSGCSGDDVPPAGMAGAPATTGGTGTGGSGTAGASGGATGGVTGTQLQSPFYFTTLTGADAMAGAAAPPGWAKGGCASCHLGNGEGLSMVGPEVRFTPPEYFKAVTRGGRKQPNGMDSAMFPVATTTLSDPELEAVNAWLNAMPKPATGEGLYKAMCGTCHGPKMATGGSAPVSIMGKTKMQVTKLVREGHGTDYANRKEYMPKYDVTLLTEADLTAIQTYLQAI